MALDYPREVERLVAELRARDTDPACASWPVEDPYGRISAVRRKQDTDKPVVQIYYTLLSMLDRDVRLGAIHEDENRSAWKPDGVRPGWIAMTARLVAGETHGMSATFVDRLMRDNGDLEDLLRAYRRAHGNRAGFTVYDVDAERLYRTNIPDDMKALRDRVTTANHDSAVKSRRITRARAARIAAGNGRNGAPPFGHRWGACGVDDAQLAAERAVIRWGIRHVTDGGSWGEVAARWTADGVTPRGGGQWHSGNVRSCLWGPESTPTVGLRHAGLIHTGGEVVGSIVDDDGPVVSMAEWRAFEAVVSKRRRGRQRGDVESPYYASGTLRCGGTYADGRPCRTPLVGTAQAGTYADDGQRRYGYKCPPRGCRGVTVDGRAAELWTSDIVAKTIVEGGNLSLLAHVGHDDRLAELDKLIADMETAVCNVERQHDAARPGERRQRAADRLERFERELSTLLDERDELRELDRREQMKPSDVAELCALWNGDATPPSVRRAIMAQCIPGGVYVRPVGRSARLRGEQIFTRFYVDGDV